MSKIVKTTVNWRTLVVIVALVAVGLTSYYFSLAEEESGPEVTVEQFLQATSNGDRETAKSYWCYRQISQFYDIDNDWEFIGAETKPAESIANPNELLQLWPELKSQIGKLSELNYTQAVFRIEASTKDRGKMTQTWAFEVWERSQILDYLNEAQSLLSELYAREETVEGENRDLLKTIRAAQAASKFARALSAHPISGDAYKLSYRSPCILTVKQFSS